MSCSSGILYGEYLVSTVANGWLEVAPDLGEGSFV